MAQRMIRPRAKRWVFWSGMCVTLLYLVLCLYTSFQRSEGRSIWIAPAAKVSNKPLFHRSAIVPDEEPWFAMTMQNVRINLNRRENQGTVVGVPSRLAQYVDGELNVPWSFWLWGFVVPKWSLLWIFCAILIILRFNPIAFLRRLKRSQSGCCPQCAYQVSDLPANSPCPECGARPEGTKA